MDETVLSLGQLQLASEVTNTLYLAHDSQVITRIQLDQTTSEQFFATSPQEPLGLSTANEYVFVCDPTGHRVSHFSDHPDGNLISQVDYSFSSSEFIWNVANSKMYYIIEGVSPTDQFIWTIGQ